jgi:signal transduction histidine kinase
MLASVLAVGLLFYSLRQQGERLPKIEEQVGSLEQHARQDAEGLLDGQATAIDDLEKRARSANGVTYAVFDAEGRALVGDPSAFPSSPFSVEDLTARLNTTWVEGESRERATALIRDDRVEGYLLVRYPLENSALSPVQRFGLVAQLGLAALLPVFFLAGSTLLFAWRLGRKVGAPVSELTGAVEKIRRRDLDFSIRYDEPDELGDLCRAFNNLRTELQESLEREWRQDEEFQEMMAALSHDLRTPATIIRGHVEGLARAKGAKRTERLDRYLPVLESSSDRMVKLLNDMMLVLSLEQVGLEIRPHPVDLGKKLVQKAEVYALRAAEHGVDFVLRKCADATFVNLDSHRLEQVLDNLFENALRFTPAGGSISLRCDRTGDMLRLTLKDTGPGVDPGILPHVFEKFFRTDRSDSRNKGSSGLGLYIAKLLVEDQGGSISLRNHPDGGCEASFSVPFRSALPPAQERSAALR